MQKLKHFAQYRLRPTPHHQRRGCVVKYIAQHGPSVSWNKWPLLYVDTIPWNGLEQTHCNITGKLRTPKVPYAFSSFPVLPRIGEQSAWALVYIPRRGPWDLPCFSTTMRPLWVCESVHVCLYFCGALCSLLPLYLNPVRWSFPHEPQALFAWYPPSFNVFLLSSQQEHLSTKPLSSLLKSNLLLLQKRDHHRIPMGDVVRCCITLYFSWDLSVCLALLPCCDVYSCLQCTLLGTPMALVTDQHSTPADTVKHRNSPSVSHPASVCGSDSSQSCRWYCKN